MGVGVCSSSSERSCVKGLGMGRGEVGEGESIIASG